jgi:WXG100 family type VII secretion target
MTQRIKAGFADLDTLAGRIAKTSTNIRSELDVLERQIDTLSQQWTGAASAAFQHKIEQWQQTAEDLRQALNRLSKMVNTANANYQSAVTTNTKMWPTR